MKFKIIIVLLLSVFVKIFDMGSVIAKIFFKRGSTPIKSIAPQSFFDLEAKDIDGNLVHFSYFKDKKVIMVVNVACKCGLTANNYKEMVNMHNELESKGFQILAFPSSEFMNQEFNNEEEIKFFVKTQFNARFPIFEKAQINGENPHSVYAFLRTHSELYNPETKEATVIPWNFAKFIVNREGKIIKFASPTTNPEELRSIIITELER